MKYELAKELKEAGFPLSVCDEPDCHIAHFDGDPFAYFHIPTLSELIEACGDEFDQLARGYGEGWVADAGGINHDCEPNIRVTGSTPEEAVARLWLALNKK